MAIALMLFGPLAFAGTASALYGRMAIHRVQGRYRGSAAAWTGYYGGMLAVAAAVVLLVYGLIGLVKSA